MADDELVHEEELDVTDGGTANAKFAAVEVKSGEEKYVCLLNTRAKLWRFDEGENVWKERGQGDARVLQHKVNQKRHMLVFRREGIGKLAAQHELVHGMTLRQNGNSDKAFVWASAADFTDEDDGAPESFAIRFATKELADEFKALFDTIAGAKK